MFWNLFGDTLNETNEHLDAAGPQSQRDLIEKCTLETSSKSVPCKYVKYIFMVYTLHSKLLSLYKY